MIRQLQNERGLIQWVGCAPTGSQSVTADQSSYESGETITVTVNGGLSGLQEWVALYVAANADSSYSYQGNWQYLNGTQTEPGSPLSYPVTLTFTAPSDPGDYNFRYFRENGIGNRLAISAGFSVADVFVADYYASPTGAGNHNGLSQANAMQISEFWSVAQPGDILALLDGTYTGANSMIDPTDTLSGTSGNPITVCAINEGGVLIDGQFVREPIRFYQNSWFVIQGVNCRYGHAASGVDHSCVHLSSSSNNNIFRRVGAWDADDIPDTSDPTVWAVSGSSNNLFEDCFGFGRGRYIFYTIEFGGDTDGNICRRCWFRFDECVSTYSQPRAVALPDYTGNETILMENCILEWRSSGGTTYPGDAPQICLEGAGYNNADPTDCTGELTIRGCLFFIGLNAQSFDAGNGHGIVLYGNSKHTDIEDLTIYIDPANSDFGLGILAVAPNATFDGQLKNVITVGTNADSINAGWSPTNVNHYSTIGSVPDPYAFLTYRWVDGTITGEGLWPWPMQQRILEATSSTSWPVGNVNADVAACLGAQPPPPEPT